MIPNEEKEGCHYLPVNKLSTLLHGITLKHKGDFYCLNFLHYFRTENKLESQEKVCKNKDFCGTVLPSEKDRILELHEYMKSGKMSYIIYADIESLIRKIDGCANNLENSSTTKISEHTPWEYSISLIWKFDHIENKQTFCTSLRKHAKNKIDFEKKKNDTVNKKRTKVTSRCKSILHLWK